MAYQTSSKQTDSTKTPHQRPQAAKSTTDMSRDTAPRVPRMSGALTNSELLALQSTAGNQAVLRLLDRKVSPPSVQRTLTVGSVNNVYEQEAHQVAHQVDADIFMKRNARNAHGSAGKQFLDHKLSSRMQQGAAQQVQRWPWSKKKKNKDDAPSQPTKAGGSPYSSLVSKFMPGAQAPIDRPLLAQAQGYAGSVSAATPDYTNPKLADQEPDQHTITLAVAQEESNWWEEIKSVKKMGIKKVFQSPRKLISKIKEGEAEQYLLTKVVKKRQGLESDSDVPTDKVEELEDLFHSVGHVWVRLSTWVGGEIKDLYSYGFWPLKTPDEGGYEMNKYVPGQVRHPDTVHEDDKLKRYYDKNITRKQFNKALALAQERYTSPPTYHLLDYNCTKFGKEILEAAGRSYPGKAVIPSVGFSPGALFAAIGKRQNKNKKGKKAYEDDPLKNIVKSINTAVEGRASTFDPSLLQDSKDLESSSESEIATLLGLNPDDYPAGTYVVQIKTNLNLPASTTPDGDYSTSVEYWPSDGDIQVYVDDNLTQTAGRAKIVFFNQTYYVPIDQLIQPGTKPDVPASSTISSTTSSTTSPSLSGPPPFIEEITLTSHMGIWDENFKDLGGSIRPGEVIGITGRKHNGLNEYYWKGDAYYIDDAWWNMYFNRPYPLAGTSTSNTNNTSTPTVSQSVVLGPEDDTSEVPSSTENSSTQDVGLPARLISSSNLSIFQMDEWQMAYDMGLFDKSDVTGLSPEQLTAFAKLVGFSPEYILDKISGL